MYVCSAIMTTEKCKKSYRGLRVFPELFCADPFKLLKITMDPHTLVQVNRVCLDDWHPKLKIYISELIFNSYEYLPVAHVKMHCMIWP